MSEVRDESKLLYIYDNNRLPQNDLYLSSELLKRRILDGGDNEDNAVITMTIMEFLRANL